MLAEGIHIYNKIVRVFSNKKYSRVFYVLGWGKIFIPRSISDFLLYSVIYIYIYLQKNSNDLISDKKVAENNTVWNFKRPNLQYSINFLNNSKAVSFLYEANCNWDTA